MVRFLVVIVIYVLCASDILNHSKLLGTVSPMVYKEVVVRRSVDILHVCLHKWSSQSTVIYAILENRRAAKLENRRTGQYRLITPHSILSSRNSMYWFLRGPRWALLFFGKFLRFRCLRAVLGLIGLVPGLTHHDHYRILPSCFLVLLFSLHRITKQQKHE